MQSVPGHVYFIGIGGIGMSALARYFHATGAVVSGYDKTPSALTDQLESEGMTIHFQDDINLLDKHADLVVYTPAIPAAHLQLNYYMNNGFKVQKRSQVLGDLSKNHFTIAVAGSHGKTTTSAMIAWILKDSGYDCTAFLGGICLNFNSNFVQGNNAVMVVEADEFDRSFHTLHPNLAVVTAIDDDHLEIYGTKAELEKNFLAFAENIQAGGALLYKQEVHAMDEYSGKKSTYSFHQRAGDVYVESYRMEAGVTEVLLNNGFTFSLQYPGLHNIENATAAATIAGELGINPEKISNALFSFKGIHRRFEIVYNDGESILIDDYAHHPEEIRMFLKSVRAMYANKKVNVVFQPHLFTRTRDLAAEFADSLDLADSIALLPVYPARELPIEGVDSSLISGRMQQPVQLIHPHQVQAFVQEHAQSVICLLGAGDIDRLVAPMAQFLTQNKSL